MRWKRIGGKARITKWLNALDVTPPVGTPIEIKVRNSDDIFNGLVMEIREYRPQGRSIVDEMTIYDPKLKQRFTLYANHVNWRDVKID